MMTAEQEARLPQYAKDDLRVLRMRLAEYARRVEELETYEDGSGASPIWFDSYGVNPQPPRRFLPAGTTVTFALDRMEVSINLEEWGGGGGERYLYVTERANVNRVMGVVPRSDNVLHIVGVDR